MYLKRSCALGLIEDRNEYLPGEEIYAEVALFFQFIDEGVGERRHVRRG